jgi:hypothetical protein
MHKIFYLKLCMSYLNEMCEMVYGIYCSLTQTRLNYGSMAANQHYATFGDKYPIKVYSWSTVNWFYFNVVCLQTVSAQQLTMKNYNLKILKKVQRFSF